MIEVDDIKGSLKTSIMPYWKQSDNLSPNPFTDQIFTLLMKKRINEKVLLILKKNKFYGNIEIDCIDIIESLSPAVQKIYELCDSPSETVDSIIDFIETASELKQLDGDYDYCEKLNSAFQGFTANNIEYAAHLIKRRDLILFRKMKNPRTYKADKHFSNLKEQIKNRYILWSNALAIKKAYKVCESNKDIIIYSHRRAGWSNPEYQLTPNFSIEIKTNFGYGRVSYFYTKLKYKNIEITPFSEWIIYERANFTEIIEYTSEHAIGNPYWLEAMEFSRDAYNLSMTDETKFVKKYIIEECEKMASGLEHFFNESHFTFKNGKNVTYHVDKVGHDLMEFRGAKISGALDFISQIIEFNGVVEIKSFIDRIEKCNIKIRPILLDELEIIKGEMESLTRELKNLKRKYDGFIAENNVYIQNKKDLENEMIKRRQLEKDNINMDVLNKRFDYKYPKYKFFEKNYKDVEESSKKTKKTFENMQTIHDKIVSHITKIDTHFPK